MKGCASFVVGGWPQPDAALNELIAKYSAREAFLVASVYALQNQRAGAFEWLDRAYDQHEADPAEMNLLPVLKHCTPTRDMPRS